MTTLLKWKTKTAQTLYVPILKTYRFNVNSDLMWLFAFFNIFNIDVNLSIVCMDLNKLHWWLTKLCLCSPVVFNIMQVVWSALISYASSARGGIYKQYKFCFTWLSENAQHVLNLKKFKSKKYFNCSKLTWTGKVCMVMLGQQWAVNYLTLEHNIPTIEVHPD